MGKADDLKKKLQEKALRTSPTQALNGQKQDNPTPQTTTATEEPPVPKNKEENVDTIEVAKEKAEQEKAEQERLAKEKEEEEKKKHEEDKANADASPLSLLEAFAVKKTVEETHKRETFLVERETVEDYNQLLAKLGQSSKGAKTKWINIVLKNAVKDLKKLESQMKPERKRK